MCGIFGIVSRGNLEGLQRAVGEAVRRIANRGPDDQGFVSFVPESHASGALVQCESRELPSPDVFSRASALLAHTRLSILDLTPAGHQPMATSDRRLWITYNGEIYNYVELRSELEGKGCTFRSSGDTEVILQAYRTWGDACVERFNGIWAFAILDLNAQRLFCARDRFGVKPLFFFGDSTRVAFASEPKQLVELPFVPRKVNEQAVYEYLVHGSFDHSSDTFFAGVKRLLPGQTLTVSLEKFALTVRRYYDPHPAINRAITLPEAAEKFRELFTDSIRLQLRSDVEVGSCLSGGIDSSSIVCTMHDLLTRQGKAHKQRTFSSHFDEPEANELTYMQDVIHASQVEARFVYPDAEWFLKELDHVVWQQDEPFGSTSIFAQWCVYRLAHQHGVKVMLDGQGADELLGGYLPFFSVHLAQLFAAKSPGTLAGEMFWYWRRHRPSLRRLLSMSSPRLARLLAGRAAGASIPTPWLDANFASRHECHDSYAQTSQAMAYPPEDRLNNLLYQLTMTLNVPTLLRYADRSSMAFSVEARVPFLDHRLVEFAFSLPARFKIARGYTKLVLRDAMKGVIPETVRTRVTKLGFATPERRWQMRVLRPLIESAIASPRLSPYVRSRGAREAFARIESAGTTDFLPWRWVNLDRWLKAYELA